MSKGTERKLTEMASNENKLKDALRANYLELISAYLRENGEEVLLTKSNTIAIPCVDSEQNERFVTITFTVPNGSRDGDEYDGYAEAQDYADKLKEKAAKAAEKAEAKAKKIAADTKRRAEAKAAKAAKEGV